jgi:hypothetical protein
MPRKTIVVRCLSQFFNGLLDLACDNDWFGVDQTLKPTRIATVIRCVAAKGLNQHVDVNEEHSPTLP